MLARTRKVVRLTHMYIAYLQDGIAARAVWRFTRVARCSMCKIDKARAYASVSCRKHVFATFVIYFGLVDRIDDVTVYIV